MVRKVLSVFVPIGLRQALRKPVKRMVAWPPVGTLSFGDLHRLNPVSKEWGFDRGLPVDRYYIAQFFTKNQSDVAGKMMEVGDRRYTTQFGGDRVTQSDVLHAVAGNPEATVVADLTNAPELASFTYDTVICTQTLNFIYDFRAALTTLHRILKPGGVLLLSVAGISQVSSHDRENWGDFWRFTSDCLKKSCSETAPWESMEIETRGNVLTTTAFLFGIASDELDPQVLNTRDETYQLIISARLKKASGA